MIYAIIDIGSNTVRLSVYEEREKSASLLFSEKEQVSLRSFVKKGRLSKKGINRLFETLSRFKAIVDNIEDIDRIYPFATATVRDVSNRADVIDLMKEKLDLEIEILSGEEEARLSFEGAAVSTQVSQGVVTDIGGGSCEIVLINQNKVIKSTSMPIGSLSAFNDYVDGLFADSKDKKKIEKKMDQLMDDSSMYPENLKILAAVGGSARASLKFYKEYYGIEEEIRSMDAHKFEKMLKDVLKKNDRQKLDMILNVKPDRVHTLLPGMIILNKICKFFAIKTINVSQTGIREGYVYSKILRKA